MPFDELLEQILPPTDHPLYEQHKRYNTEAVQRGERIASLMGLPNDLAGMNVLDIGCGTGGISVAFAKMGADVYALEPNHTHALLLGITVARAEKDGVELNAVVGCGEDLPFSDKSQDIVILNDVLEHVDNPDKVVSEAVRVLKPNGLMYLSTPNKYSFKQILREGHSGLFGVGLLPPRIASFYVTRIRKVKDRYTVNIIHSYGMVKRLLERNGLRYELINRMQPARRLNSSWVWNLPGIRRVATYIVTRPSLHPGMLEFVITKYNGGC